MEGSGMQARLEGKDHEDESVQISSCPECQRHLIKDAGGGI